MDNVKETSVLIAGRKVSGAAAYDATAESIGAIYDAMIDKKSGRIVH